MAGVQRSRFSREGRLQRLRREDWRHQRRLAGVQVKQQMGKIVLPGAAKDALKAAPEFEYAPT